MSRGADCGSGAPMYIPSMVEEIESGWKVVWWLNTATGRSKEESISRDAVSSGAATGTNVGPSGAGCGWEATRSRTAFTLRSAASLKEDIVLPPTSIGRSAFGVATPTAVGEGNEPPEGVRAGGPRRGLLDMDGAAGGPRSGLVGALGRMDGVLFGPARPLPGGPCIGECGGWALRPGDDNLFGGIVKLVWTKEGESIGWEFMLAIACNERRAGGEVALTAAAAIAAGEGSDGNPLRGGDVTWYGAPMALRGIPILGACHPEATCVGGNDPEGI